MNDVVAALAWLLANLLLVGTAWRVSRWLFPRDKGAQTIIHVVVMSWSCVVIHTQVLGILGLLLPSALLMGVSGSCLIVLAILRVVRGASRASEVESVESGLTDANAIRSATRQYGWPVTWGLLGAFGLAYILFNGLLKLPTDWDSLAYHIPLVDHWLREGTLYVPDCAFWYVPGNNEIWGLWCVAPFSGDYLIGLNNVAAAGLLAAAAVALPTALGVSRSLSHLAGLAVVAIQPMLRQLVSAENDLAVSALFFAALVYGLRYTRSGRIADLILGSAVCGLLAGIKYLALGYAGVAGFATVGLLLAHRRPRDAARAVAVGSAGAFLLASYWYWRNGFVTGTPLFPKGWTPSTDLWAVMRPETASSTLLGSGRLQVWPMLLDAISIQTGPCQLIAVLLLPTVVAWLGVSAFRQWRANPSGSRQRVFLMVLILLSGLVFLETPNVVETAPGTMNMLRSQYHPIRFGLSFVSISVIGFAVLLDDMASTLARGRSAPTPRSGAARAVKAVSRAPRAPYVSRNVLRVTVYGFWSVAVVYQLLHHTGERFSFGLSLVAMDLFVFGAFAVSVFRWPPSTRKRLVALGTTVCVLTLVVWGIDTLAIRWHGEFDNHFGSRFRTDLFQSFSELDAETERICVCDYKYYPFFGSRRQFNVCRPLWFGNESQFLHYLQKQEVTLLVAVNVDRNAQRRYAKVKEWMTGHPDLFESFFAGNRYTAVRVNRTRLDEALARPT